MTSITDKQDICHLKNLNVGDKMKTVHYVEVCPLKEESRSINGAYYSQIAVPLTTTLLLGRGFCFPVIKS
jgi:hypothetical protein